MATSRRSKARRDPTLLELKGLTPATRELAVALINEARAEGYPAVIVALGGRRTAREQRTLVRAGRSRTMKSLHLVGRAFDVDLLGVSRDRVPTAFYEWLGGIGEGMGLRWGGRFGDVGHFELPMS